MSAARDLELVWPLDRWHYLTVPNVVTMNTDPTSAAVVENTVGRARSVA